MSQNQSVNHPDLVCAIAKKLAASEGFGGSLKDPEHWAVKYMVCKNLLVVGRERCGPLGLYTGGTYSRLTADGVLLGNQ